MPCCEHPEGPSSCPNHAPVEDELVTNPPLILFSADLKRFRKFAIDNRHPDSAAAFRALLRKAGY